jgi:alpha-L-fucosidase
MFMATKKAAGVTQPAAAPFGQGDTSWFTQARFGMFIHWGLYSMPARHEWIRNWENITNEGYQKYFDYFNPDLYNPKEWARLAREAGMKYFVITTKHHEGFCLWDSKHTDYKATQTTCGKDLLRPLVEAFRAEGIRVGFYYSLIDWHHPEFPIDKIHPQRGDKEAREKAKHRDVRKYAAYMRDQVKELLTQFGKIDILWFDFSYPGEDGKGRNDWESEKLIKMVRKLQPDVIVDDRLDLPGVGDVVTPEQFQPSKQLIKNGQPVVWEACQTFSGSWGYNRDEESWRSPEELIRTLVDCVAKGGNLLMNVGPTSRGLFDYRAVARLQAYAEWMRYHSRAIHGCTAAPEGIKCPPDCRLTYNPQTRRIYLHLFAWPYKTVYIEGMPPVAYAQLLHDGSEVAMRGLEEWQKERAEICGISSTALAITLPQKPPQTVIPVVEFMLK